MATLAKGLAVLASFGEQRPEMTLSEAADVTGLSRAAARRVLRTLASLGYVVQSGRNFSLAPRILELGFAYLSSQSWRNGQAKMVRCLCLLGAELYRRNHEGFSALQNACGHNATVQCLLALRR